MGGVRTRISLPSSGEIVQFFFLAHNYTQTLRAISILEQLALIRRDLLEFFIFNVDQK